MSIRVDNLTKRYTEKGTPAVQSVTFEAPRGAITALLGPSGAGKSTILRLVAGLEIADGGSVFVADEDLTNIPVQKRGIGFVFQNYALFSHMTIYENVAFGLNVRNKPRGEIKDRVEELLKLVQLEEYARRYPNQISGGQRQRVAFARALAIQPKVLLLDEPFGALDTRVRVELREWLERLHEETHTTTLLVTHDQQEAFEVSQYVVVMHDGRVVQAGTPLDVYDNPTTPEVAQFLGASPLRAKIKEGRAEMGALSVNAPTNAREGASAMAYVHSRDVNLTRADDDSSHTSLARIMRIRRAGGLTKVVVEMPEGDLVTLELARDEFDKLQVRDGDRVRVDVRAANVFVLDYQI